MQAWTPVDTEFARWRLCQHCRGWMVATGGHTGHWSLRDREGCRKLVDTDFTVGVLGRFDLGLTNASTAGLYYDD